MKVNKAGAYSVELRRVQRYRLDASVVFTWEGPHKGHMRAEGVIRDVSVQGAFILASSYPPVGAAIHIQISLPSHEGVGAAVRVKAESLVLRVQHAMENSRSGGFAVSYMRFVLCRALTEARGQRGDIAGDLKDLGGESDPQQGPR